MASPTASETSLHKQPLVCTGTDVGTGSVTEIKLGGAGCAKSEGVNGNGIGNGVGKKRSIRIDVISDFVSFLLSLSESC
jgi:hypothetical protein